MISNVKINSRFVLITVIIFFFISTSASAKSLKVHFIDVGQGDSIFIITPNQKKILIDAGIHSGNNDKKNPFNYIRKLKEEGKIKDLHIDAFFITHAHDDHYGGFKYLCRKQEGGQDITIKNIYYSVFNSKAYGKFWPCLESMIRKSESASQIYSRGPPIRPDKEIELKILYPFEKIVKNNRDKNDDSLAILIKYRNVCFLFTGDASANVETKLLNQNIISNELKLGHHGSKTASDSDFLKKVKPASGKFYVVISSNYKDGKGKKFHHPHKATLDKLKTLGNVELYRTDLQGSIVFDTDGNKIKVETQKKYMPEDKMWKPGK